MRTNVNRGGAARRGRGFALVELAAVVMVALVLAALILAMGADSRRQARLGDDIANLRQIGAWTVAYAADNQDQYWSFSWPKGAMLSQYDDLNAQAQTGASEAASAQAVDILRRIAGREDIAPIVTWFASNNYAHLPLREHLRLPIADTAMVSSMDGHRLKWVREPAGFDHGLYQPAPTPAAPGTNSGKRWPYSSSFMISTAFYDKSTVENRVFTGGGTQGSYFVPGGCVLGAYALSDAAYPSAKAHVHDQYARHFGTRMPYCVHPQARLPILFCDGAVAVRGASESNPGWQPNSPTNPNPIVFTHAPQPWEPPTMIGFSSEILAAGSFRWTRGFLAGRDFDGPEACTGQGGPACP
ncbi:MAG: hypothetical protein ACKVU4_11540 [Phycisphaerales bacterium]